MTTDPHEQPPAGGEAESGEQPTDMATLLEESLEFRSPQRNEIVEGTVMGWDRDGVLVDIGAKSEGVIPRHEMQSLGSDPAKRLAQGDKVMVFVVQPDTADGQVLLSLDKARGEQGWLTLQERFEAGETFDGEVTGYNRGGLLVNVEGVNAFVPLSQVVGIRPDRNRDDGGSSLAEAVGKTLRLKVIEINRRRNRVILSERAALQEWRMEQKERLIQELHEGDIRRGKVSSVRNFGVFVDLGGADGLAHLSELSWERDKQPQDLFQVGDEVDVYVTKIDHENKKIALSLRRANPEQWDNVVEKYQEGQVVTGLVTKLVTFGAFARIEGPVEGLIHVSELVDRRIGHPKEVVREGDLLPLKVVRIERDRHRLGLSLRRAREEGEGLGYVFTDGGEVLSVPDEIRAEFEAREGPIPPPPPEDESAPSDVASENGGVPEVSAATATAEPPASDEAPAQETPEASATTEDQLATTEPPAAEAPSDEDIAPAEETPEASASTDDQPATSEPPAAEAPSEEDVASVDEASTEASAADETPADEPRPEASVGEPPTLPAAEPAPASEDESTDDPTSTPEDDAAAASDEDDSTSS